ncbi:proteasome-type protease [Caldimonas brevitalea]|uniref:Peptidase n=1 Tax=Caldimonas brevitalea TaxID=413882 RepID=A0A0G3BPQ5_9BURK|nr:proteasome-type protease [Caldimonas brevitalea]AKJ29968.1 peptidase [Caldimonas brevitalea]
MTYCVAMSLDGGLVFLSDSRTNAGLDQISTFRKMTVYEKEGDRVMVLLAAGNLALTQAVRQLLNGHTLECDDGPVSIWNCKTMFDAARIVGSAIRKVFERDGDSLRKFGIEFNLNLIFGGQIKGEPTRLFNVYAAGNFVEAGEDGVCYFQIGESKYGKPIIDRVVNRSTPLDQAAKCALVSMDSTLKSNLSVGLPLDLLIYHADTLHAQRIVHIDEHDPYFRMIRSSWGQRLREVFESIPNPVWDETSSESGLRPPSQHEQLNPIRKVNAPQQAS